MINVLERFTPARGRLAKLLTERQGVDAQVAACQLRLAQLLLEEKLLLGVVNAAPGSDAMARLVAREAHLALGPAFAAITVDLTRLSEHRQELDNHIQPLDDAVAILKRNMLTAANPPGWLTVSAAKRASVWAESALKLTGLLDISVPAKMPEVDTDAIARANVVKQLESDLAKAIYPSRQAA